jgi:hypothetical protein
LAYISLPDDTRARRLFGQLDQRYRAFVHQLPSPLEELAQRKTTYLGSTVDDRFEGINGLNPVLAGTPWLFWETFSRLDDRSFVAIAEAGACFVLASIVLDHLVDGQAEQPELTSLFHQALYEQGVARFRAVLPSPSWFWSHFDRFAADHTAGLAAELAAHKNPRDLALERFLVMAHGKVSPIVVTSAAMAEASNQRHVLAPIEDSLKHIAVASQLLDDIGDWRHDVAVGHVTYFQTCIATAECWEEAEALPDPDELEARMDRHWVDVEQMGQVLEWLDRSSKAVAGIDCAGWLDYVDGYRTRAEQHRTQFMARHLARVLRPLVEDT